MRFILLWGCEAGSVVDFSSEARSGSALAAHTLIDNRNGLTDNSSGLEDNSRQ